MPDIIITPSSGKLEFVEVSAQVTRRHSFTLDANNGLNLDSPLSAAAISAPLNVINVTVNNSNVNYPFVLAESGETGAKNLLMDGAGGTYNPSTNTATIDITGNSATTTLASNSTQLNGQAASYYTNIPARLGYTPVNQAGDTISGNLTVNGNFTLLGNANFFSASNIYITSSVVQIDDNIITLNAFSPYLRYAGIEMYDSGSGTLSSILWDSQGDYFFLTGSGINSKIIGGPDQQGNLTSGKIPKATAGNILGDSIITDNGSSVSIAGTISATNLSGTNTGDQTIGNATLTVAAGTGISLSATPSFTANATVDKTITVTNSGVTSIIAGTGVSIDASTGAVTVTNSSPNATHTGDVTGATTLTISNNAVTTAKITDANVTYAKIQNVSATSRVLGRITAGAGVIEELTGANIATIIGSNTVTSASYASTSSYVNFASQTANTFLAAPNGSAGTPTFRTIVAADVPTLNQNTTGTAAGLSATLAIGSGGTGATTAQAAMNTFAGGVVSGQYLRGNGTNVVMSTIQAADVPTLNQNTTGNAATATTASYANALNAANQYTVSGITGSLFGTSSWATNAVTALNGGVTSVSAGTGISVNSTTGAVTVTNSSPNATHTGEVTGATALTISSSAITTTKIADGAVTNAKLTNSSVTIGSTAVSLGATVATFAGLTSVTSTTFVGALTGNASTATTLQTARNIGGVSFNGSADINLPGVNTAGNQNTSGNAATATTASYANALNPANNYTVNSLTEGGYLAYPLREYVINLSSQSTASFYPIAIDNPPGTDATWHHSFSIDEINQSGAAAYNIHSMYGEVRGQGWTDQALFYRIFHNFYDSAERSLLGIWRGTQTWYGVVVYVRGGKNYYVRTTSRTVVGYSSAQTLGSSVFAIKNAAGADVSGISANISEMLNLVNNPSGFYHSDNAYIGTNQVLHLGTTSAPSLSIGGSAASCTGNAATATTLQNARNIGGVSFNGSADINLPGVNTAGNQNTSGNAATATTASYANALNAANNYTAVQFVTTGKLEAAGNVIAGGQFSGAGTGLTGTAAGLSIGGTAAIATTANALNTGNSYTVASLVSTGNVGIGTTNATSRLHVSGSTGGVFEVDTAGNTTSLYVSASGNIGVNTTDFSYTTSDNSRLVGSNTNNRMFVNGSIQLLNNNDAIVIGRSTATFLTDEELGFGWGGGWYMVDDTWVRVRNNKYIYGGSGVVRTDGEFQLGGSGAYFLANSTETKVASAVLRVITDSITAANAGTRGFILDGNYTNGQYRHRWRKYDDGNGLPLYIDYAHATANSYTAIARFGGGGSYNSFTVYGTQDISGNLGVGGVTSPNGRVESYYNSSAITFNYLATNLNNNSPIPVYGFDVTNGSTESRAIKAGIGYERHLTNGRGTLHFYNASTNDTQSLSGNRSSAGDIKVSIDNAGNVGIGSVSPAALLNIRASAPTGATTAIAGTNLQIDSNTSNYISFINTADNGTYAGLVFTDNNNGGYIVFRNYTGDVTTGSDSLIYGTYQDHIFQTGTTSGVNSRNEVMRIKNSGYVGINTNNPTARLQVVQGNSGGVAAILLSTDESTIQGPSANTQIRMGSNLVLNASSIIPIGTNGSERVRIQSDGNVGIGTTSAGRKLDVEGIVRTRGASGTGGFEISAATTGTAKWRIEWDSASDSLDFNWVG